MRGASRWDHDDFDEAQQLDAADPLAFARERFRLPDGVIYLDGNSLGALPRAAPAALAETAERQWGEDLIASWNKHGWIDWPTRIAAKLAPIVGAKPSELLIAEFDQRLPVQAARRRGARAARPEDHPHASKRNFPTDLYVAQGPRRDARPDAEGGRARRDRRARSTRTRPSSP